MQIKCREIARDVFSKWHTGAKQCLSNLAFWFSYENPYAFCQVKNINLHMFCANLYRNSKLPSRFCVPLPRPAQGKQSFQYNTRWNWDKSYWVSLGAQTDRREPVSPIFSDICLLWASVWRDRYFWFNLGTIDIGTESARTLRWAEQNQRGEQDLLDSDNSTLESTTWRDGTGTG